MLGLILLPGCQSDGTSQKAKTGEDCAGDADCIDGLVCYQGQCRVEDDFSDGDSDGIPELCEEYCATMDTCGLGLGPECLQICLRGIAAGDESYFTCVVESSCAGISSCLETDGDEDTGSGACLTSYDCGEGYACYNGLCVMLCMVDSQCSFPLICDPVFKVCLHPPDGDMDVDLDADIDDSVDTGLDDDKTCPQGFRICREGRVYTCDYGMWIAGMDCASNYMECVNGACVSSSDGDIEDADVPEEQDEVPACVDGMIRCNGTAIYVCIANRWVFMEDCDQTGNVCYNGSCVQNIPGALCPSGQTCVPLMDTGYMGCIEGNEVPAGNQTGCGQNTPCEGNATCHCMDNTCTGTICIGNCGVCPPGQICVEISPYGIKGCLEGENLPADSQTGCNENIPCTQNGGNAACYCRNAECSETVCVSNCS